MNSVFALANSYFAGNEIMNIFNTEVVGNYYYYSDQIQNLNQEYQNLIAGIDTGRAFYPDANFTMRLTY